MKEVLQSHISLSESLYQVFLDASKKLEAKKGEILFFPQQGNKRILFIEKGLLRGYKIIDGKDYTHHFYTENWFATDFESFLTNQSGQLYIEAMTDVSYYEFQKETLLQLYRSHHELERLGRIIAEKAFLATVQKLTDIQTLDLKSRYQQLILKNQELFLKVPQKYIASYLGVSEQSLSRIKNSLIS
ncbi:Crp/Fnr family transcriptional regulator [Algoriphagus sp.]|uniref:Crp/Fnr family transcriptional regulator n=1 Tax=Algoriphagus sp. TaxID=1872435 RepID=UPI0025D76C7A|nr:Crp/Fnr family transcriptional regulator [Algoriphagus sp.]